MSPPGRTRAWIGLGANLGEPQEGLRAGLRALQALDHSRVTAVSSMYRSAPVDAQGPDFYNAVAKLDTGLAPPALLAALMAIEARHGRQRGERHAPRTLDLDLLAYGDVQLHDPGLTLPHPRLHQRAFVLVPWLELDPDIQVAGLGALRDYLSGVADQALERVAILA